MCLQQQHDRQATPGEAQESAQIADSSSSSSGSGGGGGGGGGGGDSSDVDGSEAPRQRVRLELLALIDSTIAERVLEYAHCSECGELEPDAEPGTGTGLVVRDPSWAPSDESVPLLLVEHPLLEVLELGPARAGMGSAREETLVETGD
jgi:hypothetical protein